MYLGSLILELVSEDGPATAAQGDTCAAQQAQPARSDSPRTAAPRSALGSGRRRRTQARAESRPSRRAAA